MFRKFLLIFGIVWFVAFPLAAFAEEPAGDTIVEAGDSVKVEIFERDDCQHCADEKAFWDEQDDSNFVVTYYDIGIPENRTLYDKFTELEGVTKVTPITLIGENVVTGFDDKYTTGKLFLDLIEKYKGEYSYSFQEFIDNGGSANIENVESGVCDEGADCVVPNEPYYVNFPLIGAVNVKQYSLPVMSLILGFVDGFNPCALWVLVTFLVVLIEVGDRRRMWQIAGLFILAEAIMYYLILNVWMQAWDFVGMDNIVTPIVGVVAIGGGLFFLYEWWKSDGSCKVTNIEQRAKTRSRIQKLAAAEMTIVTIFGIIALAFSVNIIEFACSIGIPQAFTKILDINALGWLKEQFFMLLYIMMYMVDDVLVFGIALYSIEKIGLTTKYSKISNLIGGVLMVCLGLLLIFRPELLVF